MYCAHVKREVVCSNIHNSELLIEVLHPTPGNYDFSSPLLSPLYSLSGRIYQHVSVAYYYDIYYNGSMKLLFKHISQKVLKGGHLTRLYFSRNDIVEFEFAWGGGGDI